MKMDRSEEAELGVVRIRLLLRRRGLGLPRRRWRLRRRGKRRGGIGVEVAREDIMKGVRSIIIVLVDIGV